jgi:hypothetical protein
MRMACHPKPPAQDGGEGGIRTHASLKESVTYRFQVPMNANIATDTVARCPPLPTAPRAEFILEAGSRRPIPCSFRQARLYQFNRDIAPPLVSNAL